MTSRATRSNRRYDPEAWRRFADRNDWCGDDKQPVTCVGAVPGIAKPTPAAEPTPAPVPEGYFFPGDEILD